MGTQPEGPGRIEQFIEPPRKLYENLGTRRATYPLYFVLETMVEGIEWELSLERGETVEMIEKINDDWMYVKAISGSEGWAPASFLAPLTSENKSEDCLPPDLLSSQIAMSDSTASLSDNRSSTVSVEAIVHHDPLDTTSLEKQQTVRELAAVLCSGEKVPLRKTLNKKPMPSPKMKPKLPTKPKPPMTAKPNFRPTAHLKRTAPTKPQAPGIPRKNNDDSCTSNVMKLSKMFEQNME